MHWDPRTNISDRPSDSSQSMYALPTSNPNQDSPLPNRISVDYGTIHRTHSRQHPYNQYVPDQSSCSPDGLAKNLHFQGCDPMDHPRYALSPFAIRTSADSYILLPVHRRRSPGARVDSSGRPRRAWWPVVFGLDPPGSEASPHHQRHDDDHDGCDDHGSLSFL